MTVCKSYVGYYIPMSVIAAMFLTISLELPDSSCQAQSVKYAFPKYRSSSHSVHLCGIGIVQRTMAKIKRKNESSKKKGKKILQLN
jgi:hypothetical protein